MVELWCFREASIRTRPPQRNGNVPQISEEHWMRCLVAHMRGLRHKDDESRDVWLPVFDPIGNSIRTLALSEEYQPLEPEHEAARYLKLLMSSLCGDAEEVSNLLEEVRGFRSPNLNPLQPVATIAATRGHAGVLSFAFARGAQLDRNLCLAMDKGKNLNGATKDLYQQQEVTIKEELNRKIPTMLKGGIPASTFDPGDTLDDINW